MSLAPGPERPPSPPAHDLGWVPRTLTAIALVWLLAGTTGDPDLWGHVRFGLDTLALGQVPVDDPYSFTQDQPMLYHEWLSATVMALAYRGGGVPGLLVLKLAVVLTAFGVIWSAWRRVHPVVTLAAIVIACLGAGPVTRAVRPQIWTLLGLVLLVTLLKAPPTPRRLLLVAALFMTWANLHGGVILGMGVLGVWCAVSAWQAWTRTGDVPWRWGLVPLAAAAGTLVNPYGVDLWRFLLSTVRPSRDISEWQPLWTDVPQMWVPFAIAAIAVVAWRLWPSWPAAAAIVLLWILGVRVMRIAYLAVPITMLLVAPAAARRWPAARFRWRAPSSAVAAFMGVPIVVAALAAWPYVRGPFTCLWVGDQDRHGAARLAATTGTGRLVVWLTWGQYALWHLSPRLQISWDGRRETLYSEAAQQTQRAVAFGWPEGDRWLTTVRPEYVWLPADLHARRDWLTAHGYRLDHVSDKSYIAVRDDLPALPDAAPLGECVR